MLAPLRSPTMTHTTKSIYATKGSIPPPPFPSLRQTSRCHISQVPRPLAPSAIHQWWFAVWPTTGIHCTSAQPPSRSGALVFTWICLWPYTNPPPPLHVSTVLHSSLARNLNNTRSTQQPPVIQIT